MNTDDLGLILLKAFDEASNAFSLPDLDDEATITIADVLAARAAWIEDAPPTYRNLLDATVET